MKYLSIKMLLIVFFFTLKWDIFSFSTFSNVHECMTMTGLLSGGMTGVVHREDGFV
jgi:hypothetical protein